MKFLIDTSADKVAAKKEASQFVAGQLLTPLTRYTNWGGEFAIDNGAFSKFESQNFLTLLQREKPNWQLCRFVAIPDVVSNARRTLEIWRHRDRFIGKAGGWPLALVAQDGIENMDIPWSEMAALFIGGGDPWKDSMAVRDIVKTALTLGLHVHVGRVNSPKRFRWFHEMGAHTCDGSGVAMYDHMMEKIERELNREPDPTLFENEEPDETSNL